MKISACCHQRSEPGWKRWNMNRSPADQSNTFTVAEADLGRMRADPEPPSRFSKTHWWIIATLWFAWSIIYTWGVAGIPQHGPGRLKSLILTPLVTVVAPLLGAMLRDFQGCCLQVSLCVLFWALPIPIGAALLQWYGNPDHQIRRIVRLLIWMIAWLLWFASGILSFGHAMS